MGSGTDPHNFRRWFRVRTVQQGYGGAIGPDGWFCWSLVAVLSSN